MSVDSAPPPPKLPPSWLLLVYRVASEPSRYRVAVWRDMKRMGGLYLQNCVCLVPNFKGMRAAVKQVRTKIEGMNGSSMLFEFRRIDPPELHEILESFRSLIDREYEEIIEECVTKFQKEIEFERFRKNFSYEEAEEVYADLEKIRDWLQRVAARDWFGGTRRADAERSLADGEAAYEAFERECFAASGEVTELGRGSVHDVLMATAAHVPQNGRSVRRIGAPAERRAAPKSGRRVSRPRRVRTSDS